MEIKTIKEQLLITDVLQHYGLRPDRNNRLLCPFHNDKTPRLQIYPKTNTYCCFSSNCNADTGDVIAFIELKENCSKHEAILKAGSMIPVEHRSSNLPDRQAGLLCHTDQKQATVTELDKIAVLTKVFGYFKKSLPLSKKAVDYLQARNLDYKQHEVGYNSGGLHVESKNHHLIESMVKYGLLKAKPANGYNVWAKDCVIFPLKNQDNKIVSLYGRSTTNDTEQRHFFYRTEKGFIRVIRS